MEALWSDDASPELRRESRDWFVSTPPTAEKTEAMLDIWENRTARTDDRTEEELQKVWRRIAEYGRRPVAVPLLRKILRVAAVLLLPLAGAGLLHLMRPAPPPPPAPELTECFASYGTIEHVVLADGSQVWLNAGSLLVWEKNFDGATRTVYLNGEANFTVVEDPSRPFIVKTGHLETEVLGTVFNVQSWLEAASTVVTLEQGVVKVKSPSLPCEGFTLLPNEQIIFDHSTLQFTKRSVDATRETLWKEGYMVFRAKSFDEIIDTIERRFGVTVNYEAMRFEERTFTIRFAPGEDLGRVLDVLKEIVGFRYRINGKTVYIY